MTEADAPPELAFRPVTPRMKADFVALFGGPGTQRQCWCMLFRATAEEGRGQPAKVRRAQMLGRVDRRVPVGLLGYVEGRPVAWVSIAPKETHQRLGGPDPEPGEKVWSLACMILRPEVRHRGLAPVLIEAALAHARKRGATAVEAYPVAADSPSYTFMGRVSTFRRLGFHEVARAGLRRHVMRKAV